MPTPVFASPWIATPLDELMYSAQTVDVVQVVDVAAATPVSRTSEILIAIGQGPVVARA